VKNNASRTQRKNPENRGGKRRKKITEPGKERRKQRRERARTKTERGPKNRETGREQNDSFPALPLLSKRKEVQRSCKCWSP
jgi:hypothetical protein